MIVWSLWYTSSLPMASWAPLSRRPAAPRTHPVRTAALRAPCWKSRCDRKTGPNAADAAALATQVDNVKTLIPVSIGHLGTHIGAVVSLGAGAVSFTHIVKASEPVVSAALSAVMLGAYYHPITYLTLLPIVGGVALASLKELSFTWLGFIAAMISNLSSALRGILAKKTMGGGVGENMTEVRRRA